jgi:hypothetical protein
MMKLFGYLPDTLFQPLAGQKGHVYPSHGDGIMRLEQEALDPISPLAAR